MDQCIALLEEILVLTKANEPDCLFFNITTCGSDKAYVREAYKDGDAALYHLKNMGHMIPRFLKCQILLCRSKAQLRRLNL